MVAKGDDGTFVYCLYIPALVVLRYAVTGVLFILNRIVSFQNTNSNILSMFCLATNYPLFCLHTLANKVLTKQRRYCMPLNLLLQYQQAIFLKVTCFLILVLILD